MSGLFDTSIAAAYVGLPRLGLGTVLEEVLKVTIPKDKQVQRSDWSIRPLGKVALTYAAADVLHLHDLREALGERLESLGRAAWVAEECERLERIRFDVPDPEMAVFSVKGSTDLGGKELAVLKELVDFRERHALRMGRPHFRVIPDPTLVELAVDPEADLTKVRGLGRFASHPLVHDLRKAVAQGVSAPPVQRPPRPRGNRLSPDEWREVRNRLGNLKEWRSETGAKLELDPALIWPMASLDRISKEPDTLDAEIESPDVRNWQRREFADSLRKWLKRA